MLGADDKAILDFERGSWLEPGPKDQAVEWSLGLTSSLYYEHLLRIVGEDAAWAYDPLTVKRVRSLIEPGTETELAV